MRNIHGQDLSAQVRLPGSSPSEQWQPLQRSPLPSQRSLGRCSMVYYLSACQPRPLISIRAHRKPGRRVRRARAEAERASPRAGRGADQHPGRAGRPRERSLQALLLLPVRPAQPGAATRPSRSP